MKKVYTGDEDQRCPQMGGKLCAKVCPTCSAYRSFRMVMPGEKVPFEHWDCSIFIGAQIAHENIGAVHGVHAAVESFRNEAVRIEHARDKLAMERASGGAKQIAQVLEQGFTALLSGGEARTSDRINGCALELIENDLGDQGDGK